MLSLRKTYAGRIKHPDDATGPATLDPLSSIAPLFRARHGHEAVRLVPVLTVLDRKDRRTLLEEVRTRGSARATAGPDAARSQDFLYGGDGCPDGRRRAHRLT